MNAMTALDSAERAPLAPGAIFYSSWGYEQTNVDFYRVVKLAGDWITLQEIEQIEHSDDTADSPATMTGRVVPADPIAPKGEPFRRKLMRHLSGDSVKIRSYSYAWPWDGTPKRVSHYG